jgi:hypothetical protein
LCSQQVRALLADYGTDVFIGNGLQVRHSVCEREGHARAVGEVDKAAKMTLVAVGVNRTKRALFDDKLLRQGKVSYFSQQRCNRDGGNMNITLTYADTADRRNNRRRRLCSR